ARARWPRRWGAGWRAWASTGTAAASATMAATALQIRRRFMDGSCLLPAAWATGAAHAAGLLYARAPGAALNAPADAPRGCKKRIQAAHLRVFSASPKVP